MFPEKGTTDSVCSHLSACADAACSQQRSEAGGGRLPAAHSHPHGESRQSHSVYSRQIFISPAAAGGIFKIRHVNAPERKTVIKYLVRMDLNYTFRERVNQRQKTQEGSRNDPKQTGLERQRGQVRRPKITGKKENHH